MPWFASGMLTVFSILAINIFAMAGIGPAGSRSPAHPGLANGQGLTLSAQAASVQQQDVDGDGLPEITFIDYQTGAGSFRLTVIDGGQNMQWGADPVATTDFIDDSWIFDANSDGTAQLIVDFNPEGSQYTALVYDDYNGDGQVSYRLEADQLAIVETKYWHVKVISSLPWSQPDSAYRSKLTFLIDGLDSMGLIAGGGVWETGDGINGVVDWELEIGDKDGDGIDDYQLKRAVSPFFLDYKIPGVHRTGISVQASGQSPAPYPDTLFWPLLVSKHFYEEYRYFDHPAAISVDWEKGTIDKLGVLGYPVETGYHISERLPLQLNQVNSANFENPMAYYDMAGDQDGWPELQVRFDVTVPNDPYFIYPHAGGSKTPNLEVNISWDQDNDNLWDYKLNLGANYAVDEVVQFPDFAVKSVPYESILPWVKNRPWDVAMLVYDARPSPNSEGMFSKGWMIDRGYAGGKPVEQAGVKAGYLLGFGDRPPVEKYQDIQEFMRGEYSFQYFDTPKIYLSSLDHQLHLLNAQSGVWNLGEGQYLRYANQDGDAYLDQWQVQRSGEVTQELNYRQGVYVFSGDGRVRLVQTNIPPALLETQPPGSHTEWVALREGLDAHQAPYPAGVVKPDDLDGMLRNINGRVLAVQGGSIDGFRSFEGGFRFVLSLQPGFSFTGEDWLDLRKLIPGEYAVTYTDHRFQVLPLTPPSVRIAVLELQAGPVTQYATTQVSARLWNDGLQDAGQVRVDLSATQPGQEIAWTQTQTVTVLAGEMTAVRFQWSPDAPGEWALQAQARMLDLPLAPKAAARQIVQVQPAQGTDLWQNMSAVGLVAPWKVALLLGAWLASSVAGGWLLLRKLLPEAAPGEEPQP